MTATLIGNGTPSSITVRGPSRADADFTLSVVARDRVVSYGGVSSTTIQDVVYAPYSAATVDHEADIRIADVVPGSSTGAVFTALDPSIATIDARGVVSRVSDGTARFNVATRLLTKQVSVAVWRSNGQSPSVFSSFAAGSLARHCADAVDNRIAGKTPSVAMPIFSSQDHAAGAYVRNSGCWAADIDLTCCSPWNSYGGNKRAGTLVTPRHLVMANHYAIPDGATIRFVTAGNVVVTRTISSQQQIGSLDIQVAKLDSDVPGSIGFAKIMPADYATYLPGIVYGVPALMTDQEEKALVNALYSLSNYASYFYPTTTTRQAFNEAIISGDSGSPVFLIINGAPVLLNEIWLGPSGTGPSLADNATAINAALTSLGGGYQLTTVDLSGFTNFG